MKNIVDPVLVTVKYASTTFSSAPRMKYSERFADRDMCWRRFEREVARRERFRLIRRGIITPAYRMPPQMMVKVDGNWIPEIKHVEV